jgi:hypothetical protein
MEVLYVVCMYVCAFMCVCVCVYTHGIRVLFTRVRSLAYDVCMYLMCVCVHLYMSVYVYNLRVYACVYV